MKYAFFYHNTCYAIAESEEEKDLLSLSIVDSILKTITDLQFENAKNYKSLLVLENDVVTEESLYAPLLNNSETDFDTAKSMIKLNINNIWLKKITTWLDANPQSEHYSYWEDYKIKLEAVDPDSISFPISHESFMEWFNNQTGNPTKSPLQLP